MTTSQRAQFITLCCVEAMTESIAANGATAKVRESLSRIQNQALAMRSALPKPDPSDARAVLAKHAAISKSPLGHEQITPIVWATTMLQMVADHEFRLRHRRPDLAKDWAKLEGLLFTLVRRYDADLTDTYAMRAANSMALLLAA